jgi:hypothetical protein
MCHYRFYIFMGCGHSTNSSMPVNYCANAIDLGKRHTQDISTPTVPTAEPESAINEVALDLAITSEPPVTQTIQESEPATESENAISGLALGLATATQSTVTHLSQDSEPTAPLMKDTNTTIKEQTRKPKAKRKMQPCKDGRVHPLHTVRLERMICAVCVSEREERLRALESNTSEIRIEPSRWQWKYHGQKGGPPLSTRNSVLEKSPAMGGSVGKHSKVDSGVWMGAMGAMGAVGGMMKDWKGSG